MLDTQRRVLTFIGKLEPNTDEYIRRKEWLSNKSYLTEAQRLHLEFMNQNKPILMCKEIT